MKLVVPAKPKTSGRYGGNYSGVQAESRVEQTYRAEWHLKILDGKVVLKEKQY